MNSAARGTRRTTCGRRFLDLAQAMEQDDKQMSNDGLISTISQLQSEIETLGMRGVRAVSQEQLQWLRHTRDTLREMGAEFLATKMSQLLVSVEQADSDAAARLLDLLTTIRVFDRVLTLETVERMLLPLYNEKRECNETSETVPREGQPWN